MRFADVADSMQLLLQQQKSQKTKKSKTFADSKEVAKKGGNVAKAARKQPESEVYKLLIILILVSIPLK